ncbi:MAG: hypothetical protein HY909_08500 [Deltaproteobacteria bacterium]|nr:hypothetical protein [Deltaproteobacteria bacterium]
MSPSGERLAVVGTVNNRVMILDTATDTVVDVNPSASERGFDTRSTPTTVAWFPDGARVAIGDLSGRSGTRLSGLGVVLLGTLDGGATTYDVGVSGAAYSVLVSPDGTRVYVGDLAGNITALSASLFSGAPTFPAPVSERTGGCRDSLLRAIACTPAGSAGASVRAMLQL